MDKRVMQTFRKDSWLLACFAIGFSGGVQAADSPKLNLQQNITVSGVSSGGYMANQFHVAHSDRVTGAGIISAGPYFCSQGNLVTAMGQCLSKREGLADGSALADKDLAAVLNSNAQSQKVAPLANLKTDKVWLLHGTLDKRVGRNVNDALYDQYQQVTAQQNIKYIKDKAFNHHLPTKSFGVTCAETATPFIGACDYDAAGELLSWITGAKAGSATGGQLYEVEQANAVDGKATGLSEKALAYIPKQCSKGTSCQLHISFHGCQQNTASIGNDYAKNGGFNDWADKLNLIILYPQVASGSPVNPLACWDWWGYTGSNFHTQSGPQIQAIKQLSDSLIAGNAHLTISN